MKNILLGLILGIMSTPVMGQDFDINYAIELSKKFLTRLQEDRPFTYEEEEEYFGISLYSMVVMAELGYFKMEDFYRADQGGEWLDIRPQYSYLGELIRIHANELFLENPAKEYIFAGIPQDIKKDGNLVPWLFYAAVNYVQHQESTRTGYAGETKTIIFRYNTSTNKLWFPIYVDGISLAEMMGFEDNAEGIPQLKDEIMENLLKHMENIGEKIPIKN